MDEEKKRQVQQIWTALHAALAKEGKQALRAALALPDAPAPAAGERERALVLRAEDALRTTGPEPVCEREVIVRDALRACAEHLSDRPLDTDTHDDAGQPRRPLPDASATEREQALVMAGMKAGVAHPRDWLVSTEDIARIEREVREARIEREVREAVAAVNRTHPPTDAAAAERAEIVAMLSKELDSLREAREMASGVCAPFGEKYAYAHATLRVLADRIAARGPGPVWTEERVKKLAEAVRFDAASRIRERVMKNSGEWPGHDCADCDGGSVDEGEACDTCDGSGWIEEAPVNAADIDLDQIIARVRAGT